MHMVIRALVTGETEEEALDKAKRNVFEPLIEESMFDYYTTFDEEDTVVSGKARWGDIPPAVRADRARGQKLINEGMEETKKSFLRALVTVKLAMKHFTAEEIFENRWTSRVFDEKVSEEEVEELCEEYGVEYNTGEISLRHTLKSLSGVAGPDIFLYTNFFGAEPLKSEHELEKCIEGAEERDVQLWVVPADVHY